MSGPSLTHEDLRQHSGGSETFYRHAFNPGLVYTEGVRTVAQKGQAYWLLDAIASHVGLSKEFNAAAGADPRVKEMHVWELRKDFDDSAALMARVDDGEEPFVHQDIPWTDFPLEELDLWACESQFGTTLMLPCEY